MERNHGETIYGRIQHKVMMMMQGARIMENELMRKVYNKPVKSLKNILKDSSAKTSNLCEARI